MSDVVNVDSATRLEGMIRVPGDKSASHRALMISALASGTSRIEGLSPGDDVSCTSRIMVQLGALRRDEGDQVFLTGPSDGLRATSSMLDCGNSGTTMRLLSGLVSGIAGRHELIGDASLSRRPMDRVATPLGLMGAKFTGNGERMTAPLIVSGSDRLRAIDYHVPTSSAQVKSAILFAGLRADGATIVREDIRTRTTTEDMFQVAGIQLASNDVLEGRVVTLQPGRPRPTEWRIPGDPSQAAFFCVLGLIHRDARIEIVDIDNSPERTGFIGVLQRMGADLDCSTSGALMTIIARSSQLEATEIHSHEIPSVDEVPILTVAAAAASGTTIFRDMGELRLKESDRFQGSIDLARSLGCEVTSTGDDFFVKGLGSPRQFSSFSADAGLDHRMVMSSAVAGTAGNGCTVIGASTVASSYTHFFRDLASLQ